MRRHDLIRHSVGPQRHCQRRIKIFEQTRSAERSKRMQPDFISWRCIDSAASKRAHGSAFVWWTFRRTVLVNVSVRVYPPHIPDSARRFRRHCLRPLVVVAVADLAHVRRFRMQPKQGRRAVASVSPKGSPHHALPVARLPMCRTRVGPVQVRTADGPVPPLSSAGPCRRTSVIRISCTSSLGCGRRPSTP